MTKDSPAITILLAAILVVTVTTPSANSQESPPNVLLVVIDTLRADRVGAYGNDRGLTPFLDSLATRGVVFANAYAQSSWTSPSIASLFTSRHPTQHRVGTYTSVLVPAEVTLAERLREANYRSGGFSANLRLAAKLGFAQGFDEWRAFMGQKPPPDGGLAQKPRGHQIRNSALRWLDGELARGAEGPRMLYLHYMEPHPPFDPPQPFKDRFQRDADGPGSRIDQAIANSKVVRVEKHRFLLPDEIDLLESLYDAEVAAIDDELRLIFDELEHRGFLRNAVIIVTSDHGTEFKEHGRFLHGTQLYNEIIKVPLLLLASAIQGGSVVADPVSLVDIAPTLLDLLGLAPEPRHEGTSLVPLLAGTRVATKGRPDVLSQLLKTGSKFDLRRQVQCLIRQSTKLTIHRNGTPETFDLAADPGELKPNPPSLADKTTSLRTALDTLNEVLALRANPSHETEPIGEELKERLRALGYRVDRLDQQPPQSGAAEPDVEAPPTGR